MCGGETAASTPHCSLKSHSLRGWFTRARQRGTPNSCFARSVVTRLSSSSPVTATTTSTVFRSACSSTHGSHASPRRNFTFGETSRAFARIAGSCSISVTSWARSARSAARCRPTAPAPVMTTRIGLLLARWAQELVQLVESIAVDQQLRHVVLLEGATRDGDEAGAHPIDAPDQHLAGELEGAHRLAHEGPRGP